MISCNEPVETEYDSDADRIIGKWIWVQSSGGIGGITETPESTGIDKSISFSIDGTLIYYQNDTLKNSSAYYLGYGLTIFSSDSIPVIYTGSDHPTYAYEFENDKVLIMSENYHDGFAYKYHRE